MAILSHSSARMGKGPRAAFCACRILWEPFGFCLRSFRGPKNQQGKEVSLEHDPNLYRSIMSISRCCRGMIHTPCAGDEAQRGSVPSAGWGRARTAAQRCWEPLSVLSPLLGVRALWSPHLPAHPARQPSPFSFRLLK